MSILYLSNSKKKNNNTFFYLLIFVTILVMSMIQMSQSLSSSSSSSSTGTRTILITGATDGIGRHTAGLLASDKNNRLLVHGRKSFDGVGSTLVNELLSKGALSAKYYEADLSDLQQVEKLASNILSDSEKEEEIESIDVLINNAGIFDPQPLPAKSEQGYDLTFAVNVLAPFLLTRRLLPLIIKSNDPCPRIITTSSISQSWSLPPLDELFDNTNNKPKSAHSAYSDSKLGDYMFTVQLAKILQKKHKKLDSSYKKIKCLTMDPGTVNTKMLLAGWGPCGIPISRANNTYKLATAYGSQQESGTYHFGGGGSRDAKDSKKLQELWNYMEDATGCTYNDI